MRHWITRRRKPKNCADCSRRMSGWSSICANCQRIKRATKNPENIKLRQAVIDGLGGKCSYCQEDRMECLDVDHVNGDGPSHRRELAMLGYNSLYAVYNWLIDNNFNSPYKLQLLCRSCHNRKHWKHSRHGAVKVLMRNGVLV